MNDFHNRRNLDSSIFLSCEIGQVGSCVAKIWGRHMDGVKILPALNKRYQEIPFDDGVSDKREVVINLIEIVAAIKRKISDEPMKIVDFYKTSEFSISREQVASIDWVSGVREHPFSAHIEFANVVDKCRVPHDCAVI